MTLHDLFKVFWTITEVGIIAREPDGMFIHEWKYGNNIRETTHMFYDRIDGKLTIVPVKVNDHGGNMNGWGVNEKIFHKELLSVPITHMNVFSWHSGEHRVDVDVEIQRLTAEVIVRNEQTT